MNELKTSGQQITSKANNRFINHIKQSNTSYKTCHNRIHITSKLSCLTCSSLTHATSEVGENCKRHAQCIMIYITSHQAINQSQSLKINETLDAWLPIIQSTLNINNYTSCPNRYQIQSSSDRLSDITRIIRLRVKSLCNSNHIPHSHTKLVHS